MSPHWIKYLIGSLYAKIPDSIKFGKIYKDYLKLLDESQWWSEKKIEEYQWTKLEQLLNHAYENVPYYRDAFNAKGIMPKDIKDFSDFKEKVPILTKDIIRENLKFMIAINYPRSKGLYVTTGGSSGIPLGLYYQKGVSRPKEFAFVTAMWKRVGYKPGDKLAVLRGHLIKNGNKNKFFEYEPIRNRLILSSFHMLEENLPLYIEEIIKFKPLFIHAYPSSLTILANYVKNKNIKGLPGLKGVLIGSETILPWQISLFNEVFKCRVFFWYGLTEMCALASICECSDYYHIFPEYSYVELVDTQLYNGEIIEEIIGTTFDNYFMPLIRYKTMDYAVSVDLKCKCGRNHKLLSKILGRSQDFFIDSKGNLISFICADIPLWDIMSKIKAYQYEQYEPGKVELDIESSERLDRKEVEKIIISFKKYYPNFEIKIKFVENIPRTERGKFKYLNRKIPINLGENAQISK